MDAKVNLWVKNKTASKEEWHCSTSDGVNAYAAKYAIGDGYNWQAWRDNLHRLSGSADSIDEAKSIAEQHMALPPDEFKALLIAEVMRDFDDLLQQMQRIDPAHAGDNLYDAGRRHGYAEARNKMLEILA